MKSVKTKIILVSFLAALLPVIAIVGISQWRKGAAEESVVRELDILTRKNISDISKDVYHLCKTADDLVQMQVNSSLNVADYVMKRKGAVTLSNEMVQWSAVNQSTKEASEISLPKFLVGGKWLGNDKGFDERAYIVDEIQSLVGGTCTIFQRMNEEGDMLRVSTNVKTLKGERAIGTFIPHDSPVIQAVLAGDTYRGTAYVVNAWYNTAYQPIFNPAGKVIGILYVGVKQESVESLRNAIMDIVVGESGYVFVLGGSKPQHKGKYIISHQGKSDGAELIDNTDADGKYFIKEIIDSAVTLNKEDVYFQVYNWKNEGESVARTKITAVTYYKPWDWVIGAGAYEDDFQKAKDETIDAINNLILLGSIAGLIILAIMIAASFITGGAIANPIKKLTEIAEELNKGNVAVKVDVQTNDEVGVLADSFRSVTATLSKLIEETNTLVVKAENGQLDARADASGFQGGYQELIMGFNNTLDNIIRPLNMAAEYVDRISKGDIPPHIEDEYKGDFNEIKNNLNQCINALQAMISDANMLAESAKQGKLDKRADADMHQGDFGRIIGGMNDTLNNVVGPLNMTAEYVDRISKGDIPEKIMEEYQGDYNEIKNNLNQLIDNLNNFIEDMQEMARQQEAGEIDYKIDESKFQGAYQEMAKGFNATVNEIVQSMVTILGLFKEYGDGNFEKVLPPQPGKRATANQTADNVRNNLMKVSTEISKLIKGAAEGKLDTRADSKGLLGEYKDMVDGLNKTLDSIIDPIRETADVLQQMAEGNLSIHVTNNYKGDHNILKDAINQTVDLMPFREAMEVLSSMADGDMTTKMEGNYKGDSLKLKNAVNETIDAISHTLLQIQNVVEEVTRGALQVADASTALSQGATEQAASLEEITSSMTEIGSQTKTNAENANEANTLTISAKDGAEKGNAEMGRLNEAMAEITESSKNISKIIKVIDEIAFQTNLLALNAAVEAARAGRHGKGFAVVAEEVRNLAARSATAAKETSELIENSIKTVENGSELAIRTGEALEEIKNGSIKAADIVGEITTSSNEQAQGIAQINEGLTQIDKVTQTNTASAEESASASEELSGQANQLREMIARFKIKGAANEASVYDSVRSGKQKSLPAGDEGDDDF